MKRQMDRWMSKQLSEPNIGVLGKFATLQKATTGFVMPVSPHGTTRLPLDGFSWNLIVEFIIHTEKSNKIQQYVKNVLFLFYMKLNMFRATHRPLSGA